MTNRRVAGSRASIPPAFGKRGMGRSGPIWPFVQVLTPTDMLRMLILVAIVLTLGALPADAACEWTQRAGKPYIACDPGPASLSPPNNPARPPTHVPEVPLPPLAETPPPPPVAGTPAPPLAPAPPLGPPIAPEQAALPQYHSQPPPTLNPGAPGLLAPPGGVPALPGAR